MTPGEWQPRVLLAGAFGQGNPGDASVLAAFRQGLAGCAVDATGTTIPAGAPAVVARAALRADAVAVAATVFKTLHPASGRGRHELLRNTLALAVACRAAGKPVALAGVGAGDLGTPLARSLARQVAAAAGTVETRDEESAEALRAAGVRRHLAIGADVTWTLVGDPPPEPPERPPLAVIALSHLAGGPTLASELATAAGLLRAAGVAVALQPWQPGPDDRLADAVAACLAPRPEVWAPPVDVPGGAAQLAAAGVVVGLRFHSLVAAAAAGVPFVAVAHEPKLAGLSRRLDQIAVPPTASGQAMAAAALRALHGPAATAAAVRQQRSAATATVSSVRALAVARARRRQRRAARLGRTAAAGPVET